MTEIVSPDNPDVPVAAPEPDTDAAFEFLQRFAPDGPWVLAAIKPEGGGPEVKTFEPKDEDEARRWINKHNGQRNLYFQVNPSIKPQTKKASKTDIKSLAWLHVDVDPRSGEDIAEEQKRILALFTDNRPDSVLEPTCVIFSGGGYQAFWRLENPVPIDGDLDRAAEAERYNRQLESHFGADICHNVDRIMRLPGTINIPTKKKRELGRARVLARLESFDEDRVYPIDRFDRAEASASRGLAAEPTDIMTPQTITDLSDLNRWNVPDRVKIIIAQGRVPDEPKRDDDSRSAWLFDACCNLVRCRVPDGIILGLLLNPGWGISVSVLEQRGNAEKYARRQIERAKSVTVVAPGTLDEEIARINESYFAALTGGKVRFWRENTDSTIELMDKSAFLFELATRRYRDQDDALKKVAPIWLEHTDRRYYPLGFVLDPHAGPNVGAYNLWRGFAIEPVQGDWSLMQNHITQVLAGGNDKLASYITNWTAWSLQNPATPPRVALVFRGGQGVGKGMFAGAVEEIFGTHGMRIQNMQHLVGKFNAHLRHLCLLFADEAVVPNSDGEGALKGLITEPTIPIEAKGVDVVNADNHLHVIMATNNEWAVPAAAAARRFAVFDVAEHRKGDHDYFAALVQQVRSGGKAAMLHDLLHLNLGDFHPEKCRPATDALSAQMDLSMAPAEMVVQNMLHEGEVPCDFEMRRSDGRIFVATTLLANAKRLDERQYKALGLALRAVVGSGAESVRQYIDKGYARQQHRGFWLPPLELARQNWARYLGREVVWPEDVTTWAIETTPMKVDQENVPF